MVQLISPFPIDECREKLLQSMTKSDGDDSLITIIVNDDGSFWLEHFDSQPTHFRGRYYSEKFEGQLAAEGDQTQISGEFAGDFIYFSSLYLFAIILGFFAFGLLIVAFRDMNWLLSLIPLIILTGIIFWLRSIRGLGASGRDAIIRFLKDVTEATSVELE